LKGIFFIFIGELYRKKKPAQVQEHTGNTEKIGEKTFNKKFCGVQGKKKEVEKTEDR
jgi:hypothetical protein